MTGATHYIEQYRQKNRTLIVRSPVQDISRLQTGLNLTKASNCITIAVFKIKFKPGCEPVKPDES